MRCVVRFALFSAGRHGPALPPLFTHSRAFCSTRPLHQLGGVNLETLIKAGKMVSGIADAANNKSPNAAARAFASFNQGTNQPTEDTSSKSGPGTGTFATGVFILSCGIVLVNLNERRVAKQDELTDLCEGRIVSLNEDPQAPAALEELDGKVLHAHGDAYATAPWPRDEFFKFEFPNQLRMHRSVAMYQWRETKHEESIKDSKEKKVWYTYEKVWSTSHLQCVGEEHSNPTFPHWDGVVPNAEKVSIKNIDRAVKAAKPPQPLELLLSTNFVNRMSAFISAGTLKPLDGGDAIANQGLALLPNGQGLASKGKRLESPDIGDMHVTYTVVAPAAYSVLGKYALSDGVVPFTASLNQSLASHAPMVIPKEATDFLNTNSGHQAESLGLSLTPPSFVVDLIERWMLSAAPIEFAHIEKGHQKKIEAFRSNRHHLEEVTGGINAFAGAMTVLGCMLMVSPTSAIVGGGGALVGGAGAGMAILAATTKGARDQVRGNGYVAKTSAKSDVAI